MGGTALTKGGRPSGTQGQTQFLRIGWEQLRPDQRPEGRRPLARKRRRPQAPLSKVESGSRCVPPQGRRISELNLISVGLADVRNWKVFQRSLARDGRVCGKGMLRSTRWPRAGSRVGWRAFLGGRGRGGCCAREAFLRWMGASVGLGTLQWSPMATPRHTLARTVTNLSVNPDFANPTPPCSLGNPGWCKEIWRQMLQCMEKRPGK